MSPYVCLKYKKRLDWYDAQSGSRLLIYDSTGYFTDHKCTQFYPWLAWKTPSRLKASISRLRGSGQKENEAVFYPHSLFDHYPVGLIQITPLITSRGDGNPQAQLYIPGRQTIRKPSLQ
jgi:hypothetical protein